MKTWKLKTDITTLVDAFEGDQDVAKLSRDVAQALTALAARADGILEADELDALDDFVDMFGEGLTLGEADEALADLAWWADSARVWLGGTP